MLAGSAASVLVTLAVLTVWARVRYARDLSSFRCRIGPPAAGWRRQHARWCLRCTRAAWVNDVLVVRTGALRLWLEPLPVGIAPDVTVRTLGQGEVRGLGARPVSLRFTLLGSGELEVAVAAECADRLVGPFITAALSKLPNAPREHGN
ncbi:hypothetical protein [Geodermatophilus sabuli]|uniref:hypothetical protein n=1 Tax=Geodermatophilus sabuli TaxID=1564158 RepID=UPI0015589CB1|nr:hypothetical protein [Geodermatophilus sabuli]MBB3084462.1 hypothetical protein [Geodermatophilus sabuli]